MKQSSSHWDRRAFIGDGWGMLSRAVDTDLDERVREFDWTCAFERQTEHRFDVDRWINPNGMLNRTTKRIRYPIWTAAHVVRFRRCLRRDRIDYINQIEV